MRRWSIAALLVAFALFGSSCKRATPENVAASVNGRIIPYNELDKQFRSQFMSSTEQVSDDQKATQRLEILRNLIDAEIMLQRAQKLGLMATDADVDSKLAELKSPFTQEEFQKQLAVRKMSLDDLKAQIRRELSIDKLFNKEIKSHITISDKDVAEFYNANKSTFDFPEPKVHMAQILVTPKPDANVQNLKNDKAQSDDQAKEKIKRLQARLQHGEDFGVIAQNFSEDPMSAPNGGDLGFVPESALDKANPELRKALMSMAPGQLTPIIQTSEGYRILKVISKEPSGQRELSDPRVQENIRETLRNRKDQLLRAAYYEVARDEAKVDNYLALSITKNSDKR